jgi:hypothetical protein
MTKSWNFISLTLLVELTEPTGSEFVLGKRDAGSKVKKVTSICKEE